MTFFEVATAMAFCYFADCGVEYAVCEVGLGGRLDATNVLRPACTVVTCIDIDHQSQLGHTKEEIAREKLGTVKEGVPVVTAEKDPAVIEVHREVASGRGSRLVVLDSEAEIDVEGCDTCGTRFSYRTGGTILEGLHTPAVGLHQARNAALAIKTLEIAALDGAVDEAAMRSGLASTRIPGRFQIVEAGGGTVVLDVAHNAGGAGALALTARRVFPGKKAVLLIGMSADKDRRSVLARLVPLAEFVIVTRPDFGRHERRAEAADLLAVAKELHGRVFEIPDVGEAVEAALDLLSDDLYLLVTGSFYTVAEAMMFLGRKEGGTGKTDEAPH